MVNFTEMKKILISISFICCFFLSYGQAKITRSSAANTVFDTRHGALLNSILPAYLDTTQANLTNPNNIGIDSCGAIIFTYAGGGVVYVRKCYPVKHWAAIGGSGGGTVTGAENGNTLTSAKVRWGGNLLQNTSVNGKSLYGVLFDSLTYFQANDDLGTNRFQITNSRSKLFSVNGTDGIDISNGNLVLKSGNALLTMIGDTIKSATRAGYTTNINGSLTKNSWITKGYFDSLNTGGTLTLSAIGSSPNADGATITGTVLNLQPASASFGGVMTTGAQTIAGTKTFNGTALIASNSFKAGGASIDASAVVDIESITKGFLMPRMTQAQRDAMIATSTGLQIYQTDNTPGFYYYNGSAWVMVGPSNPTLQQVITAGADLTVDNAINLSDNELIVDSVGNFLINNYESGATSKLEIGNGQTFLNSISATTGLAAGISSDNDGETLYLYYHNKFITSIDTSSIKLMARDTSLGVVYDIPWSMVAGATATFNSAYVAGSTITSMPHAVLPSNKAVVWDTVSKQVASATFLPLLLTAHTPGQAIVINATSDGLINATISATPAGGARQIQFYNGGAFGATDSLILGANGVDIKGRYLINGITALHKPDNTNFLNSSFGFTFPASLSHTTGITGQYNTAFGSLSGNALTTGAVNVFFGSRAGQAVNTGTNNTFIGEGAGIAVSSGTFNTAIGSASLTSMQTGSFNTAIGASALAASTGTLNTAGGYRAMQINSTGANNTGFGSDAGFNNATGSNNAYFGSDAGKGATGGNNSNNTAIGFRSLLGITTGKGNITVGDSAGHTTTTGFRNIVMGTNITTSSATADYEMNIGGLLFGTGMTATGTSNAGLIGIRTNAPTHELTLNGQLKILAPNGTTDAPDSLAGFKDGVLTAYTSVLSGTFSPTATIISNMDAVTVSEVQFLRIGNTVTVSGRVTVDPTTTVTSTSFRITLPVASNLAAINQCGGTAAAIAIAGQVAGIYADATNNEAIFQWIAADVTNQEMYFTFTYRVI